MLTPLNNVDLDSGEESSDHDEFQIDASLHESYIKMLQNNVSNEEWSTFCEAERHRMSGHGIFQTFYFAQFAFSKTIITTLLSSFPLLSYDFMTFTIIMIANN